MGILNVTSVCAHAPFFYYNAGLYLTTRMTAIVGHYKRAKFIELARFVKENSLFLRTQPHSRFLLKHPQTGNAAKLDSSARHKRRNGLEKLFNHTSHALVRGFDNTVIVSFHHTVFE